jgi:hypothetical protein
MVEDPEQFKANQEEQAAQNPNANDRETSSSTKKP